MVENIRLMEVMIRIIAKKLMYQQALKRCEDSAKGLGIGLSCSAVCKCVVSLLQMKMNVSKTMVAAVRSV